MGDLGTTTLKPYGGGYRNVLYFWALQFGQDGAYNQLFFTGGQSA